MSTHTTYFCDRCNADRDFGHADEGQAISHDLPTFEGWAELEKPYVSRYGGPSRATTHICAHCLADPDVALYDGLARYGEPPEWDTQTLQNIEKGRKHAERYEWALNHLGTADPFGMHGVRQVFGTGPYWYGPKLRDGRFYTDDRKVTL